MSKFDFTSTLQIMLKQAAENISKDKDIFSQVHRQLIVNPSHSSRSTRQWYRSQRLIGIMLVATILISGFAYAAPTLFQWLGDRSLEAITLDHATNINRQITVDGITLHLDQAYADAVRTAVTFHVSLTSSNSFLPIPESPVLTDLRNHIYGQVAGQQVHDQALVEFEPLPPDKLDSSQTLKFTVNRMDVHNLAGDPVSSITGIWQITFQLKPLPERTIIFNDAPLIHNKLGFQLVELDIAPSGVRLLLQISNLPPDTSLHTLSQFATRVQVSGTSPDRVGTNLGASSDGTLLQLHLLNGQILVPALVEPWDTLTDRSVRPSEPDRVIGSSEKATIEALFYTALEGNQGTVMIMIDHIRIASYNEPEVIHTIDGPWKFSFSLNRS
jgi:hypothetical protein